MDGAFSEERCAAGDDEPAAALAQLLSSAAQLLPRAQRSLVVLPADGPGPAVRIAAEASGGADGSDARSAGLPIAAGTEPSCILLYRSFARRPRPAARQSCALVAVLKSK